MRKSKILVIVSVLCGVSNACDTPSITTVKGTHAKEITPGTICSGDVIFEETFDTFDLNKWQHEITLSGGGNWEFQYYNNNRTNSFVEAGYLHIRPTFLSEDVGENGLYSQTLDINGECTNAQSYGCLRTGTGENVLNPIKSARIRTFDSFSFKYGKVEVNAKVPSGDWLWPAIWLLPRYNQYGGWPSSGEIDIMESRGNENLQLNGANIGSKQVASTLHWGPDFFRNMFYKTSFPKKSENSFSDDFHKYQLEWNADGITFLVDNVQIGVVKPPSGGFWEYGGYSNELNNPWKAGTKMAPFDQHMYIILNLAVGGINYFSDEAVNSPNPKPWNNNSPHAATDFWKAKNAWFSTWNTRGYNSDFIIDYVKVWAI